MVFEVKLKKRLQVKVVFEHKNSTFEVLLVKTTKTITYLK